MHRTEQLNEFLQQKIAEFLTQELRWDKGLITVVRVNCSADLRNATVFISVLPEKLCGSALRLVRQHNIGLAKYLSRHSFLRRIPKFNWKVDPTEKRAAELDKIFALIEQNKNHEPENNITSQSDY
ncbi:ribosome-binding factor A [Candidatus Parcubacteria bacterium]|nr:MAG: ribosome-binding factor A [Candidatus Parcubacteria bacterium]